MSAVEFELKNFRLEIVKCIHGYTLHLCSYFRRHFSSIFINFYFYINFNIAKREVCPFCRNVLCLYIYAALTLSIPGRDVCYMEMMYPLPVVR